MTAQQLITFGICPHLPKEYISFLKSSWKKAHPEIKIKIVPFLFSNVKFEDEKNENFPDVFIYESILLPNYVKKNIIREITQKPPKSEEHYDFVMDSVRVNDKIYGIPIFMLTDFLFSKKSLSNLETKDVGNFLKENKGKCTYNCIFEPFQFSRVYHAISNTESRIMNIPKNYKDIDQKTAKTMREMINNSGLFTKNEFLEKEENEYFITLSNNILKKDLIDIKSSLYATKLSDSIEGTYSYKTVVLSVNKESKIDPEISEKFLNFMAENRELHKLVDKYFLPAHLPTLKDIEKEDPILIMLRAAIEKNLKNEKSKHIVSQIDSSLQQMLFLSKSVLTQSLQHETVSTIRCLAADMVQQANSGHPGMPIGMSPTAYVIWKYFLNTNPENVDWINRDRFILSGGHGCTLQYSLLYLSGVTGISIEDLKQFRQLDSITPGHPEKYITPGIEATTGPLGQGISNSVGMAIAQKHLAASYNTEDKKLFDHFIYTLCGDGDLMEGVALEGIAIAGRYKLDNLILFYDDNQITIDGPTHLSFSENISKLFDAYGWHVQEVQNGNFDLLSIKNCILNAQKFKGKPHLIRIHTTIGFSSIKQGSEKVHGSPLGPDGVEKLKEVSGYFENPKEKFVVPEYIKKDFETTIKQRGIEKYKIWQNLYKNYEKSNPEKYKILEWMLAGKLPENWEQYLPKKKTSGADATRKSSGDVLNSIAPHLVNLIGGSADLTPSNNTWLECSKNLTPEEFDGRYIRFGVREHGMCAVSNGIALYGAGLIPFAATFLVFAGYSLGAIRLSAISEQKVLFLFTHDSIGLGEDGPTHQPVETLPTLRSIPNLLVFRPCDTEETAGCYMAAINAHKKPSLFALSRQNLPHLEHSSRDGVLKGAYIVKKEDSSKPLDIILVGSGSEVELCLKVAEKKSDKNIRVVSFPCWELFEEQDKEYKESVLGKGDVPVLAVEAAIMQGWEKYSHYQFGMNSFGASAPAGKLFQKFGFTVENITKEVENALEKSKKNGISPLF